jgi:hypothetical protein
MFGQKFTNTNEMLQWKILYCAKSAPPDSAELNTAHVCIFFSHLQKKMKKKRKKESECYRQDLCCLLIDLGWQVAAARERKRT